VGYFFLNHLVKSGTISESLQEADVSGVEGLKLGGANGSSTGCMKQLYTLQQAVFNKK